MFLNQIQPCQILPLQIISNNFYSNVILLFAVFLVLAVLGWILSTLDASLAELQPDGGNHAARNINFKISRNGLKHRKPNT